MLKTVFALLMLICFAAAGCAVNEEPAIDLPPLTLPPPLEATFSGTCDNAQLLETWLQTASFQYDEFIELLNTASMKSPQDLYADVERIAVLRATISLQAAPDCAAAAHVRLLGAIDAILPTLLSYVNGEEIDISVAAAQIQPTLAQFEAERLTLLDRLELAYRESAAGS